MMQERGGLGNSLPVTDVTLEELGSSCSSSLIERAIPLTTAASSATRTGNEMQNKVRSLLTYIQETCIIS